MTWSHGLHLVYQLSLRFGFWWKEKNTGAELGQIVKLTLLNDEEIALTKTTSNLPKQKRVYLYPMLNMFTTFNFDDIYYINIDFTSRRWDVQKCTAQIFCV